MSKCFSCTDVLMTRQNKLLKFIANVMAFTAPSHTTYDIEFEADDSKRGTCSKKVKFIHKEFCNLTFPWLKIESFLFKKCLTRKNLVLLYIKNTNPLKNKSTIIYSHGNNCDLGSTYSHLIDLSTQLKMDVISYDYSGYGRSEGMASEESLLEDIESVLDFASDQGLKPSSMILMGSSMGSVPTVHAATQAKYFGLLGLVLLSPIASGIKLINPRLSISTVDLEKIDMFSNITKVSDIDCPVFLIHGMQDEVIPYNQSVQMMHKIKHVFDWFPKQGNHSNIISKYRYKFFSKMKLFIEQLMHYRNVCEQETLAEESASLKENNLNMAVIKHTSYFKHLNCEENYMSTNKKKEGGEFKPLRISISNFSDKEIQRSPQANCMSVNRPQLFDCNSNKDILFSTQSVEEEGEMIFNKDRSSENNYYNIKDAKELEYQFNQIQKNVS